MKSNSQSGQDIYAWEKSGRKNDGFYIEIGAYDPFNLSNSFMLEEIGWRGISFEMNDIQDKWSANRKNTLIICDAVKFDFLQCFIKYDVPKEIDYLSLDIDAASLDCLKTLPLDKYLFKSITIEHDEYIRGKKIKEEMRDILEQYGYILDRPDVSHNGCVYEDWWVI
jgi:hypothetical protein